MRAFLSAAFLGGIVWLMSKLVNRSIRNAQKLAKQREEELREQTSSSIEPTRLRKNPDTGIYEPYE